MPLKHAQETRLVVALGIAIAMAGIAIALLPPLPAGMLPWVVLFLGALLYPVLLSPMLRRNRADNVFRRLHWFPAGMLILWFALQEAAIVLPSTAFLASLYAWGWTIGVVALGFFLLFVYCLQVIRQRLARMVLLALFFIPYATGAFVAERQQIDLRPRILTLLPEQGLLADLMKWGNAVSSIPAGDQQGSSSSALAEDTNLAPSEDRGEERWRASLRAFKDRMERALAGRGESGSTVSSSAVLVGTVETGVPAPDGDATVSSSGMEPVVISADTIPESLPSSGMDLSALMLAGLAGYSATLHVRARQRVHG